MGLDVLRSLTLAYKRVNAIGLRWASIAVRVSLLVCMGVVCPTVNGKCIGRRVKGL